MNDIIDSIAETLLTSSESQRHSLEAQIDLHLTTFKRLERDALSEAVLCGHKLVMLKPLIAHGSFEAYIEEKFGITRNRASQWMRLSFEYAAAVMGETLEKLPTYSAAVELLESRMDTPEVKTVKAKIKNDMLIDGVRYSVAEIKALKDKAKALEAENTDLQFRFNDHVQKAVSETLEMEAVKREGQIEADIEAKAAEKAQEAYDYANRLQQELAEKEDAIQSLQNDIEELLARSGQVDTQKIANLESAVADLTEQAKAKQQELAQLDVALFEKQDQKTQYRELNLAITTTALSLDEQLNFLIPELQRVRKTYFNAKLSSENIAFLSELSDLLQKSTFSIYQLMGASPSKAEGQFQKHFKNFVNEQACLLEQPTD